MRFLIFALIVLNLSACRKKVETDKELQKVPIQNNSVVSAKIKNTKNTEAKGVPPRALRAAIYFASSLERESLRLILKNEELQKTTLFGVLSYSLESKAGVRKNIPRDLDCAKIESVQKENAWVISKTCRLPFQEMAFINELKEKKHYEVIFNIEHWSSVLGMSAAITGSKISCSIYITDDEKLDRLSCQNWAYQVSEDKLSSTVVRADQFEFNREAQQQFVFKGGFYQELVKNKNIDLSVPMQGKIKILEKELKVIDDFSAYKDGVINEEKIEKAKNSEEKKFKVEIGQPVQESKFEERNEFKAADKEFEKNQDSNQQIQDSQNNDENKTQDGSETINSQPETNRRGR
jgi:hypothetical protein